MMRKLTPIMLIAVCIACGNCTKHRANLYYEEGSRVIFSLDVPHDFIVSRSLTAQQEKAVDELTALVFNSGDVLLDIQRARPAGQDGTLFAVDLPDGNTQYNVVLLANATAAIAGSIGTSVDAISADKRSYDDVMAAIDQQVAGRLFTDGGSIPMWSTPTTVQVSSGGRQFRASPLRAVARIDVGVGSTPTYTPDTRQPWSWDGKDTQGNDIPFELTEVIVMRPNSRFALAPAIEYFNEDRVVGPTIPANARAFTVEESSAMFTYQVDNGLYSTQNIYVPEADIAAGVAGDAMHSERMAIVVGGKYGGSATVTYYRVDFVAHGAMKNVLRNHIYQFCITKVDGAGYNTVPEAYNAVSMNITTDVIDWRIEEMDDIVLEGKFYCVLGRGTVELAPEAGDSKRVSIQTNVEDFTLSLDSDPDVVIGMGQTTYTSPAGLEYTLTRQNNSDIYTLTVSSQSDNFSASPVEHIEQWTLRARHMTIPFEASQAWEQAYNGPRILAPPGVLGITESGKLTLRGARQYQNTPAGTNSEFGDVEDETVFLLYWQFSSLIGIYNTTATGDIWAQGGTVDDIVWYPQGYDIASLKAQNMRQIWGVDAPRSPFDASLPTLLLQGSQRQNDPSKGLGDPCTYADTGTATDRYISPTVNDYEKWPYMLTSPRRVTLIAMGTPVDGIVAHNMSGTDDDWSMFLPLAGMMGANSNFPGSLWYNPASSDPRAMYWTIPGNEPFIYMFEPGYPPTLRYSAAKRALPIRCVRE